MMNRVVRKHYDLKILSGFCLLKAQVNSGPGSTKRQILKQSGPSKRMPRVTMRRVCEHLRDVSLVD
ncbi:hypothetical protein E2C01_000874 [Portunus trituberculatus]|uniref:Uncharacterized protein n=1 Tax=Portunus trituberculatus TaxID=210409 RepID=A0A5B7CHS0_PORTR|nr:hypothetical protein [Portunus trituberculatus]